MTWPRKIAHGKQLDREKVKVMFPNGPRMMPAHSEARSVSIGRYNYLRYVDVPDHFSGFSFVETVEGVWYAIRDGEYNG